MLAQERAQEVVHEEGWPRAAALADTGPYGITSAIVWRKNELQGLLFCSGHVWALLGPALRK